MEYTIRQAVPSDMDNVLALVQEFHTESLNDFGMSCNEEKSKALMPQVMRSMIVLEVEGKLVGLIAGLIVEALTGIGLTFQEIMWYVSKKHRRYGIKLYRELERYCLQWGVNSIVMANMGDKRDESFHKFYLKEGFRHIETQYMKKIGG